MNPVINETGIAKYETDTYLISVLFVPKNFNRISVIDFENLALSFN